MVAACILPDGKRGQVPGLNDSKLLTAAVREEVYGEVVRRAVAWSVVVIPAGDVDRHGLHVMNIEGMRRAVARLDPTPAYALTDGFPVRGLTVPALAVPKGDATVGLHRRGLGAGQGDQGPDHGRDARALAGVRVRQPQGVRARRCTPRR